MSSERWQRVEELFHLAADLSPAQRNAFLEKACAGDDDLERQVESLLAHDASRNDVVGAAIDRAIEQLPEATAVTEDLRTTHAGTAFSAPPVSVESELPPIADRPRIVAVEPRY